MMIRELRVRNIALIEKLDITFEKGLSVITGETGAGKSILLNAIKLAFGGKVGEDIVRTGKTQGSVELIFDIDKNQSLKKKINQLGIQVEDGELVIRKEIRLDGRGRMSINTVSVPNSTAKEYGEYLIDISSQHSQQSLLRVKTHLNLLDNFGGLEENKKKVSKKVQKLLEMKVNLASLSRDEEERKKDYEMDRYAIQEIELAELYDGEEEDLEKELKILGDFGKLQQGLEQIYEGLYLSEAGVMGGLERYLMVLEELKEYDEKLVGVYKNLNEALFFIENEQDVLRGVRDELEYSPNREEKLNERLVVIKDLKRKYGLGILEILKYQETCKDRQTKYKKGCIELEKLKEVIKNYEVEMVAEVLRLSKKRQTVSRYLESSVMEELKFLGISKALFRVEFRYIEDKDSFMRVSGKGIKIYPEGIDRVEFIFSANSGEKPKPLIKIASGGELSRVMLAIKGVLSQVDDVDTLLFDEVDVGIGGEMIIKVGKRIRRLAKNKQILCITHSPQIASEGENHYYVEKEEKDSRTKTFIRKLENEEDRVKEIARMLSGNSYTEVSLKHAKELLNKKKA